MRDSASKSALIRSVARPLITNSLIYDSWSDSIMFANKNETAITLTCENIARVTRQWSVKDRYTES